MKLKNPLCLALDVDSPAEALKIAEELKDQVGVIKVGPRLTNLDSELVGKISKSTPVFVDHKYYDIPSTMEAAIRSTFKAGASFVTIHASAGTTALKRLAKVEAELNSIRPFKILAVTVLTSFEKQDLPSFNQSVSIEDQVLALAIQATKNGITGLVCSPHEVTKIRSLGKEIFIVTPGIRPANSKADDQKRTMTAAEAMKAGANILVVGRPILEASNRKLATSEILKELS